MQPEATWLAAIVSSSNDAILSVTCDGVVTSFNPAAERLFGYREEEIVGRPTSILIPADRQEEREIVTHIVAGKPLEPYETIRLRKNGSLVNVSVSISPLRDAGGKIVGAAEIARDISERKQTNDAVLRSLGEGVYTIDQQGLVTFMNPAAEELFGWSFAELRGKKMHDMTHHHYRDGRPFPSSECAGFQVLTSGRPLKNHEDAFIRKDGTFFNVIYTITPMRGYSGKINGLIVVFSDITERKRAEEQQKFLMTELDHRVKDVLARVAAIADATCRDGTQIDEFIRSYNERIQSMAAAHALLSQTGWSGTDLSALIRSQLAPYATDANVTIAGPDIMLGAPATQALAMVLHELVTNAVKYGGLSIPGGRVSVSWERKPNGSAATNLSLVWREGGGPSVASEIRSSYGTGLIRELIPHELGGKIDLVFGSEGACCRIELPLEAVSRGPL